MFFVFNRYGYNNDDCNDVLQILKKDRETWEVDIR